MQIRNWKEEMQLLVDDFQFYAGAGDLEKLKELVTAAEKIAEIAAKQMEGRA